VSLEGGVTGLGADFIIIDDPVQIKDSENEKQLQRVNSFFDSEIRTRLNNPKKGAIVIVAHRLAEDDLPGHVLDEGGWTHVKLPLIAPRSRTFKTDQVVWRRDRGELLRPDAYSQRDVERLRRARRPNFEFLHQQNPGAQDDPRIKSEHIGIFTSSDLSVDAPIVLSIDPALKGGPSHSFSVVQAWAVPEGRYLLIDQWREQATYREFRAEVLRFIRGRRPSAVLIEETAQGPALASEIRARKDMQIVLITPVEDKVSRIRRHLRTIRGGIIRLPEHAPWRPDFIAELTTFPNGSFDDQVDALTQFLDWIAQNPVLTKRSPRALAGGFSGHGIPLGRRLDRVAAPAHQTPGGVLARRRLW